MPTMPCGLRRAAAVTLFAVAGATGAGAQPNPDPVLVFAASSLAGSLDEVARNFLAATGISVSVSYAASSVLARQIEAAAPSDLFISADIAWMDHVAERNLIDPASRTDLLGNRIVLIAPAASTVTLTIGTDSIAGALGPDDRMAMADTAAVPAGRYGKAALEALGEWTAIEPKVVAAENVRAALAFVARGETPLGIVYATDAAVEPAVRVVDTFAGTLHPPIVYPAALTGTAPDTSARAFMAYLTSPAAAEVFAEYGFSALIAPTP